MKHFIPAVLALMLMLSCNNEKGPKALVLYYSQNGATKAVAEQIQAQTGADICAFDVAQAYDGNFEETIQRCLKERESGFVPDLLPLACDISKYDVIFLGYPIWFGTYAPPVKALLNSCSFEGKTVVPFCTFGSGGLQSSMADLLLPGVDIRNGYGVRTARVGAAAEELNRFLIENGWKEGQIDPLPEFSEQQEVTEEETAVFNAACSDYQFPLGTPVTTASRSVPGGTEYLFIAQSESGMNQIYVLALEGKNPEFTQVLR